MVCTLARAFPAKQAYSQMGGKSGCDRKETVHDLEFCRLGQAAVIINLTCKPVLSEFGSIHLILVEGRDITAYKQTSAALNQIEARFQTIFEQAEMGILIKVSTGKCSIATLLFDQPWDIRLRN